MSSRGQGSSEKGSSFWPQRQQPTARAFRWRLCDAVAFAGCLVVPPAPTPTAMLCAAATLSLLASMSASCCCLSCARAAFSDVCHITSDARHRAWIGTAASERTLNFPLSPSLLFISAQRLREPLLPAARLRLLLRFLRLRSDLSCDDASAEAICAAPLPRRCARRYRHESATRPLSGVSLVSVVLTRPHHVQFACRMHGNNRLGPQHTGWCLVPC